MALEACRGCRERDARIFQLERRLAQQQQRTDELEQRVAEVETLLRDARARLGQNATNSSLPPAANPPAAPQPVIKKRTGKKPGGQPGHPAHLRQRLPKERVCRTVDFVPRHCDRCQQPLSRSPEPNDPEPTWHQVAEPPEQAAEVTEYLGHYRTCPRCGTLSHASIPQAIKAHSIGPRFAATPGYLTGSHRVSKRGLEEIAADVSNVPLALGTIAHLEGQLSAALAPAHAEALGVVRAADVKNVDETG
jgi:transposase